MPLMREPIFHDRQAVSLEGPITTTSATFVDIDGAVLITDDLSLTAFYQFWASIDLQHSNNNSTVNFRICVDGVPSMGKPVSFGPSSAGNPQGTSLIGESSGIDFGSVIQLQWNTDVGTAQINNLVMMFDGIPDSRVI